MAMTEFAVQPLLETPIVRIRAVHCRGSWRHESPEECANETQLVFPYRGVFVRHLGGDQVVGDANQVLFFNAGEGYRVSHPVVGGDSSLTLVVEEAQMRELAPRGLLRTRAAEFGPHRLRIDPRTQALVALLQHSLRTGVAESLQAESLALTLVQRAVGPRTTHTAGASVGRQRLVDRAKIVLASDLKRRWTLSEIAKHVGGGSPVYLTQTFQQVEGVPLYRYQLRLRLARALDLLAQYEDLTALALDLGFSSHSHFSAAFREMYGRSPSQFRQSALNR
jgi:AraC family transcriptional regulator